MAYETAVGWAQIIAMIIFGAVMAGVLLYALRPGNRAKFDRAARLPLVSDEDDPDEERKRSSKKGDNGENGGVVNGHS